VLRRRSSGPAEAATMSRDALLLVLVFGPLLAALLLVLT
jgi:hypothetical protein